jgi:riboflavin biosynthesis pyrimidine reductase
LERTAEEEGMEPGTLVLEDGTVLPPDPAESVLRELYALDEDLSVRLSMIRAGDGSAVGPDGTSRSLNGPEDLRILRVTRSWADVVIVGGRTALAEAYRDIRLGAALTEARVADGYLWPPHIAIVSRSGDIPEGLDPQTTLVLTTADAPAASHPLAVIVGDAEPQGALVVERLAARGYSRLLCEGGPNVAALLVGTGLVTDYCLTTSPLPPGDGPQVPAVPEGARLLHSLAGAGYVMERWAA